ncbi:MAG: hypothetical protein CSB23_03685 [Deltaproteobacteria bacterium]|nr:MAG: hypothetical protein CSB23_03685 [Deltaproteobacteria bacterium]
MDKNRENKTARERLVEAAIDIFGRNDYKTATTRMIAAQAKVNISAIPYYFGGKEGLYHAVIEHIVAALHEATKGFVVSKEARPFSGESGQQMAAAALEKVLGNMVDLLIGSAQGQRFSRIIQREQMYPSSAYDIIFSNFMGPFLDALAKLITIAGNERSPERAKLRAIAIFGQILVFRAIRETVVRSLDFQGYSDREIEQIREVIIDHTRAALE